MSETPASPTPSTSPPTPAPSRWRRRALIALVGVLLSPLALYAVSRFYFRHVPFSVPENCFRPATGSASVILASWPDQSS